MLKNIFNRKASSSKHKSAKRKGAEEKSLLQTVNSDFITERDVGYDKLQRLRDLDVFVLDNSLRESTVAQLRGHTLENKTSVYEEVKKCGFKDVIVASYGHNTRVDDVWVKNLVKSGEDPSGLYAFSEVASEVKDMVPSTEGLPIALVKMKDAGLRNVIFEMDLSDVIYDFEKFPLEKMLDLVKKWIEWTHENLHQEAKVLINYRDIGETMKQHSNRVFESTEFFAKLPKHLRPFALVYEDVSGLIMPEEVGSWARNIRRIMDANDWKAHLLVHVHEKYGFSDASQLQSLIDGANGVWASVCSEGASLGHASSTVTLMNLIRLGNKKVTQKYNCQYLRKAAYNVTQITTGAEPHPKQPIYGARALDFVFNIAETEFDLAEFFEEKAPIRITTLASPAMIVKKLVETFGEDDQFTEEIAVKMKEVMIDDLTHKRKEEYMSAPGLAVLFDRAGGKMTERMMEVVVEQKDNSAHAESLIKQVRETWDSWDAREEESNDEMLTFDSFYDGFMQPYFACYRCADTKKALQAIDMDADGQVDWNEFLFYLKWALGQNPQMKDTEELLDFVFRKGIIPAMRDELTK